MPKAATATSEAPRTLREEQRAYTQRKLMEAGLQVFDEHGYTQASIDQVVAAAGASRATFYLHFKSKAQLMEQVIIARQAELLPLVREGFSKIRTRSDLRSWLDTVLTDSRSDGCRYLNVRSQAALVDESVARLQDKMFDGYIDAILADRSLSSRQEDRARVRVRLLILQLERAVYFWLVRGWDVDYDDLLDALTDSWVAGLPGSFIKRP